jgi:hypothetical protein
MAAETLDYQSPQPKPRKPLFVWPADWRRRLVVAAIAALIVFTITFAAARNVQGPAIAYSVNGGTDGMVYELQRALDDFVKQTGRVPTQLTEVPAIAKIFSIGPQKIDQWGNPYQLLNVNGKPVVASYGRDGRPGGVGLSADITTDHRYGTPPVTFREFVEFGPLGSVLMICSLAALVTALVTFAARAGAAPDPTRRGLRPIITAALATGLLAVIVGSVMAVLHTPSGH